MNSNTSLNVFNTRNMCWMIGYALLAILVLAIQTYIPMHNDNIFFLYAAQKWLGGGTYVQDFFDTNPPLIIMLNVPIIWLAKITMLNMQSAFCLYMLFFVLVSLVLSSYLLKKIINERNLYYFMMGSLAFTLLLFPDRAFGQREHLWVVFSLPYLFSAVLNFDNKKVSPLLAAVIGIFAGIGFALKPYFLTTFILLEVFFIYKKKNIFAWVRIESICVLSVIVIYLWSVYHFFPDYIYTVTPLLFKYYSHENWRVVVFSASVFYSLLVFIIYGATWRTWAYPSLSQVLMLASLGSVMSLVLSRSILFYHVLPMLSFAIIIASMLLQQSIKTLFYTQIHSSMILRHFLMWMTGVVSLLLIFPMSLIDYLAIKGYRFPIVLLALCVTAFFAYSLQKIIKEPVTRFFLTLMLILTLFFSAAPFPKKEQLYLILMFPYMCGILLKLYEQSVAHFKALIIGIALGIAISLNYYLMIPIVMAEAFFLIKKKKISAEFVVGLLVAFGLSAAILKFFLILAGLNLHWVRSIEMAAKFIQPQHATLFEKINFAFCGFVFFVHFIYRRQARYPLINNFLFLILCGFVIYALIEHYYCYDIYATLPARIVACLLIALIVGDVLGERYQYLVSNDIFKVSCKIVTVLAAGLLLFFVPLQIFETSAATLMYAHEKDPVSYLAEYLKNYPNSTFDFYAPDDSLLNLGMYYPHQFVGKHPMLWWYSWLQGKKNSSDAKTAAIIMKDEDFFVTGLADKLNQNKPQFVIIQLAKQQYCTYVNVPDLNFLKTFLAHEDFKKAWAHYRFLTNIDFNSVKFYEIYKRV